MQENYKSGERVKHATKTEWGIGEVLADQSGGRVKVFFEDVGAKEFDIGHARFVSLSGDEGKSDYLTALVKHYHAELKKPVLAGKPKPAFMSFSKAVQNFLSYFPSGFSDPEYLLGAGNERNYKLAANQLMLELLGKKSFEELLQENDFKEICDRAKRVVNKTNLISPYEKIWLSNGLGVDANQERFAESLFDLLYGESEIPIRFERFSALLTEIGAAKWPIATYFLFITFPKIHMFLKPVVTQDAANVLGQEINYKPELNWLTYSQVLALAERIRKELHKTGMENMAPQDMIDVQSFIWVTAPGYFQ